MKSASGVLGTAFTATRVVQLLCLIPLVGISANFVSLWLSNQLPDAYGWRILLFTLSLACILTLYCALTLLLSLDGSLPGMMAAAADFVLLLPIIVLVALSDRHNSLSSLSCGDSAFSTKSANGFASSLTSESQAWSTGSDGLASVMMSKQAYCKEMKAIWALEISMSILLFCSSTISFFIWNRRRREGMESLA